MEIPFFRECQPLNSRNTSCLVSQLVSQHLELEKGKFFTLRLLPRSYHPEYLDSFRVCIDNIMQLISQTFPSYPAACCTQLGHFCDGFDMNLFNLEVVRLGTYILCLQFQKDAFVRRT